MNSESSFFKLGLFVVAGIALAVAGVVVLGAGALFQEYVTVETATEGSVEGLTVGGAVKHNGVTLGKVSKIEMATWRYGSPDPVKREQIGRWVIVEMQIR